MRLAILRALRWQRPSSQHRDRSRSSTCRRPPGVEPRAGSAESHDAAIVVIAAGLPDCPPARRRSARRSRGLLSSGLIVAITGFCSTSPMRMRPDIERRQRDAAAWPAMIEPGLALRHDDADWRRPCASPCRAASHASGLKAGPDSRYRVKSCKRLRRHLLRSRRPDIP